MKYIYHFVQSAGTLFLAAALVALLGNLGGLGHLHPHDPVLEVPVPVLFWLFSGVSLAAAWVCFSKRMITFQLLLIGWWSLGLAVYQIGAGYCAACFSAYLQDVAVAFAISSNFVNAVLQAATVYLLSGSSLCLFWLWYCQTPSMVRAAARFQKMSCPACGVHIQFSTQNAGQRFTCPQCRTGITLRPPDERIKTSCFFCKGHIEFPAHAIGTKMACPHCKMDITLKEAA